jgi:hypothetical protein
MSTKLCLELGLEYENQGKDLDAQDLWVKANYKF